MQTIKYRLPDERFKSCPRNQNYKQTPYDFKITLLERDRAIGVYNLSDGNNNQQLNFGEGRRSLKTQTQPNNAVIRQDKSSAKATPSTCRSDQESDA
ncbi:hypothetical protein HBA92_18590 [Ochrobactrum sp. MR28]|nr:hypothetical protein [Ochrobactrum sp. MR28]MBX8818268.1 hypothetical protein [Ochrobactrum sp. MR31]